MLSYEAVHEAVGLSRDAYDTAVEKLIEKGYLVLRTGKTVYDFYEVPQKGNIKKGWTQIWKKGWILAKLGFRHRE